MEYVLLALAAQFVVPGLTLLAAAAAGYFTARSLGIPEFRPFRRGASEGRSKRHVVRIVTVVTAFVACLVFGAFSAKAGGAKHSSMTVFVHSGPARGAGMLSGDRILSIDGKRYEDFDAMRADIQASRGPRSITFERNGERFTRVVDPMPERRIGVSAQTKIRPATFGEAIERGFVVCLWPFRYARRFFRTSEAELSGPVGIKSLESATVPRLELFLYAGAIYAAFIWPLLALVHLVDFVAVDLRREGVRGTRS